MDESEATWEDIAEINANYPNFNLEDKVDFKREGIAMTSSNRNATLDEESSEVRKSGQLGQELVGMDPRIMGSRRSNRQRITNSSDDFAYGPNNQTDSEQFEKILKYIRFGVESGSEPLKLEIGLATMASISSILYSQMFKVFAFIALGEVIPGTHALSRDDFPPDFVFGSSTSAYQVEGATNEDGRKPSIWDTFAHTGNGNLYEGDGDVACDQYHKYKEDVQLMANMGLDAYRFSISWSRLIPDGKGPINPKGLQYYNNLINELISHGIQPYVTLHHWDLPQTLDDEYGGWVSRRIVKDFTAYADVCFREFGDRVKYWTTVNEANIVSMFGYDLGILPPQRCSSSIANCSRGNSSTEPYLATHHMLLAHASAARLYRKKYQSLQHGFIGFNLLTLAFVPQTNTSEDISATQRAQDFTIGWFLNPFIFGDYPDIMKKNVGSRLPFFTQKESNLVKGSIDFLGINFYYTFYVKNSPSSLQMEERDYMADMELKLETFTQDGTPIYEIPITTWSLQGVLDSLKKKYGNFPIYIHENGQQTPRDSSSLDDWSRVKYLHAYIGSMLDALRSGSNVRGYFVWSFLDAFELLSGYESSFGLYYLDLKDPSLRRQPKLSAEWYSNFLNRRTMDPKFTMEIEKNTPVLSHTPFLLHNAT